MHGKKLYKFYFKLIQVLGFGPKQKTFVTALKCFIFFAIRRDKVCDRFTCSFFVVVYFSCDGFTCQDAWSRDYSAMQCVQQLNVGYYVSTDQYALASLACCIREEQNLHVGSTTKGLYKPRRLATSNSLVLNSFFPRRTRERLMTGRRLISWIYNSSYILVSNLDRGFYARFRLRKRVY